MPMSGRRVGSAILSVIWFWPSYTYLSAIMRRSASRFSGEPPSQYWKESMKLRASCALSDGRYLRTLGRVRRSLSMEPSKDAPFSCFFFFMNSPITDCDCPSCAIVNEPTLLRRITSGMEGKMSTASSLSRSGVTTSTTFSASSCTKMSEPMKTLAVSMSAWNALSVAGLRSSSRRYPTVSIHTLSWPALMRLLATVIDDWYCDSSTTYTTLNFLRPLTFSGMIRRSSGLLVVKNPPPPDEIIGSSEMAMRAAPERSFGRRRKLFAGGDDTRAARSESPDFGRKAEPGLKADAWGTTAREATAARTAAPATAPRRNTISLCRNSS
mmetsp:Transcript_54202/g.128744  ORF Transcript_54202/g.128744 Transcript_54202/m.128744 type:complete len:325 (-) Transcript_54202:63-1037(-)